MEINACWAERGLSRTIVEGIDRIGIVQVSDFAVGTLSTPNRLVPGDGDIPLRRIVDQHESRWPDEMTREVEVAQLTGQRVIDVDVHHVEPAHAVKRALHRRVG